MQKRIGSLRTKTEDSLDCAVETMMEERVDGFFQVEHGLEECVPDEFRLHAHHWLILHGRYVCKARKPECERCVISDLCLYDAKTVAV